MFGFPYKTTKYAIIQTNADTQNIITKKKQPILNDRFFFSKWHLMRCTNANNVVMLMWITIKNFKTNQCEKRKQKRWYIIYIKYLKSNALQPTQAHDWQQADMMSNTHICYTTHHILALTKATHFLFSFLSNAVKLLQASVAFFYQSWKSFISPNYSVMNDKKATCN